MQATIETTIEMTGKLLTLAQQKIITAGSDNADLRDKALRDLAIINRALVQQNLELWTKVTIAETELDMSAMEATLKAVEQDAAKHCKSGLITPTDLKAPHTKL